MRKPSRDADSKPVEPASAAAGAVTTLASAHTRFARVALGIYLGAVAIAVALVVLLLITELSHEREKAREDMLRVATERVDYLGRNLATLAQELRRLGLRSEVDLLDQNLTPEKSLLELSHHGSTFFNLGVAIIGVDGALLWSEPPSLLPAHTSFAGEPWFAHVRASRMLRIVPIDPPRPEDAAIYVVSPIVRDGQFTGAIVGAIDLARSRELNFGQDLDARLTTVVATRQADVVYPATPPAFATEPGWRALFVGEPARPFVSTITLQGRTVVTAAAPVQGTDLLLLFLSDEHELFRSARARFGFRLGLVFVLALVPVVAIALLLRRSLRVFRASEDKALREERLRLLGEAANLIAHEVKNSLNGIKMAAELACDGLPETETKRHRALGELRQEIARLSAFAGELMTFSKGIVPRTVLVDFNEIVTRVAGLAEKTNQEAGIEFGISLPESPAKVSGDPQLLHVVVSNLIGNAQDALGVSRVPQPKIDLYVRLDPGQVVLEAQDNGPGVPPSMRSRLFEPFQSGKSNGVGIGLALSRRIALAHGGDLVLESTEVGALFVLTLPRLFA